jgi:hypothetical protein
MGAMKLMGSLQQENFKGLKLDALMVGLKDLMVVFLTSFSPSPSV